MSGNPIPLYRPLLSGAWESALLATGGETQKWSDYAERPVDFLQDVVGRRLWAAQRYVLDSLIEYHYVTWRGPRKSSKSDTAASAVVAWMCTAPTVILTTAPTQRTVREILWQRIRRIHAQSLVQLPGRLGVDSWRIAPMHFAMGFSTSDPRYAKGHHGEVEPPEDVDAIEAPTLDVDGAVELAESSTRAARMLWIFDEANSIDQEIYDAVLGSLSGSNVYALMIANPLMSANEDHTYARSHREGGRWHRVKVAPIESDDPVPYDKAFFGIPHWLQPASFLDDLRAECGGVGADNNPVFQADGLANFVSADASYSVISHPLLVSSAEGVVVKHPMLAGRHIGIDVGASEEGDPSVATLMIDGRVAAQHVWFESDTMKTVEKVVELSKTWGEKGLDGNRIPVNANCIHVDPLGIGKGAADRLNQLGYAVDFVDFGARPVGEWHSVTGQTLFTNRRAELHWVARRLMEERMVCVPEKYVDNWRQAGWAKYEYVERSVGRMIKVEGKPDIKSRYGRSPDHHDSLLYALSRTSRTPSITTLRRVRRGR